MPVLHPGPKRRRGIAKSHSVAEAPLTVYPSAPSLRDRWILDKRPARNVLDEKKPYAFFSETEAGPSGEDVQVSTVFLTNRECPWRCLMCDLWRNTLEGSVSPGAITAQIRFALERLPHAPRACAHLKLYNAGSFFDRLAIPPAEYPELARLADDFCRTIVESHPALIGDRCLEFRDLLSGQLEVAMGLETAHPEILERLNKRMTLEQFRAAARFLAGHEIDLRVFILVRPPWLSEEEGVEWAKRSVDFAFDCGAIVCSLIPTRANNGAMEALAASGEFSPPTLASLERALEYGLERKAGRIFADLWELDRFYSCPACSAARADRIRAMNATQKIPAPLRCDRCMLGL
jgi:radical SAM enzyme (TIGR01210 family)